MNVRRLTLGFLETNCWLADDSAGGPLVIIDPADDAEAILAAVDSAKVAYVVLTHGHFDHLAAVRDVLAATHAPLAIHADDAENSTSSAANLGGTLGFSGTAPVADMVLNEGDTLSAGRLRFEVLHTPGHTPGGICLFAEDPDGGAPHLFSGDTLFASSVGRTDFPGGSARALQHSVARLASLPAETIVHPGHGPETTIGREIRVNPFFPRA